MGSTVSVAPPHGLSPPRTVRFAWKWTQNLGLRAKQGVNLVNLENLVTLVNVVNMVNVDEAPSGLQIGRPRRSLTSACANLFCSREIRKMRILFGLIFYTSMRVFS